MLNHIRRQFVVVPAVLLIGLGVVFTPTLLAQRVARTQRIDTLKPLTLSGKGGAGPTKSPGPETRPRLLSVSERALLFKGRTPRDSFTLSVNQPMVPNKASLSFRGGWFYPNTDGMGSILFWGPSDSPLYQCQFHFKAKVGRLYALDIMVRPRITSHVNNGTFTITNVFSGDAQTIQSNGQATEHITAYISAEDTDLVYSLSYTHAWVFHSIEITEL